MLRVLLFISLGPFFTASLLAAEPSSYTIKGRVTDQSGNAISARVRVVPGFTDLKLDERGREHYVQGRAFKNEETLSVATDANGEFELTLQPLFENPKGVVIAEADGYGPTWQRLSAARHEADLTLRLVKAADVTGRIVDSNGRPLPGAEIQLKRVHRFHDEDIEKFLKIVRDRPLETASFLDRRSIAAPSFIKETDRFKTDKDGKFTIPSIGANRVVKIHFHAEGQQDASAMVVTSSIGAKWRRTKLDKDTRVLMDAGSALPVVYSNPFTHIALPAAKISGIVVNRETQEPMPNVGVMAQGKGLHGIAFTNKEGRFEFDSLPPRATVELRAIRPPAEMVRQGVLPIKGPLPMPFLVEAKRGLSYSPTTPLPPQKFELSPAITVMGRVTDEVGKPVAQATVRYVATESNQAALKLHDKLEETEERTDANGAFAIPVLPGPGLLLVSANGDRYRPASADNVPLPKREGFQGGIVVFNNRVIVPEFYQSVKLISPKPDNDVSRINLRLEKQDKVAIKIRDQEGNPVRGADVKYLHDGTHSMDERLIESSTISLSQPTSEHPTLVMIRHQERQLGAVLILTTEGKTIKSREVVLRPCGTLTGRFVREDKPIPNLDFMVRVLDDELTAVKHRTGGGINDVLVRGKTDDEGRFRIPDMICGQRVRLSGIRNTIMTQKQPGFPDEEVNIIHSLYTADLSLRSGESKDLGDLVCSQLPPNAKPRK